MTTVLTVLRMHSTHRVTNAAIMAVFLEEPEWTIRKYTPTGMLRVHRIEHRMNTSATALNAATSVATLVSLAIPLRDIKKCV